MNVFDIPNASNEKRKTLIFSIIKHAVDTIAGDLLDLVALQRPIPLLTKDDLNWLLEELLLKERRAPTRVLSDLIVNLSFSANLDELAFVWDVADISSGTKGGAGECIQCQVRFSRR